jgi:hypothetical protein
VLMVVCMPLALVAAGATYLDARPHDARGHRRVELGLPAEDLPCRRADIAAVLTQPDAADQPAPTRSRGTRSKRDSSTVLWFDDFAATFGRFPPLQIPYAA